MKFRLVLAITFALCVLTMGNQDQRWVVDNDAQLLLANIGRLVLTAWPRAQVSAH